MTKHLDHYNNHFGSWACYDGSQYLYGFGVSNYTTILRKTATGQTYETRGSVTSINSTFLIRRIYATSIPGLIFVEVYNPSYQFYLLRSEDYGATFTNVFAFGEGNGTSGTQTANVRLLNGFCECLIDTPGGLSAGALIIGEYNIASGRVAGGVNDRVRIMISLDHGMTWAKKMEWNTADGTQVGHIHAIYQDQLAGYLYICTGDDSAKSSLIRWDGSADWAYNATPATIAADWTTGFKCAYGTQHHRTVGMLFTDKCLFTFSDTQKPNNPGGVHSGIWRWKKDLSGTPVCVNNQIYSYDPMHVGWYSANLDGVLVFTTAVEYIDSANAWVNNNPQIYVSHDAGKNWHSEAITIGRTSNPASSLYQLGLCVMGDKLLLDNTGAAGFGATNVLQLEDGPVAEPTVVHPVRYIGNWHATGVDSSSNGFNRDGPGRTLGFYLNNNRIGTGTRVRVAPGSFAEDALYVDWHSFSSAYQGSGSVIIEGSGEEATHVYRGIGAGYLFYLDNARILSTLQKPLRFKKIHLYNPSQSTSSFIFQGTGQSFVKINDNCKLGDETQNITNGSGVIKVAPGQEFDMDNIEFVHNPAIPANYGSFFAFETPGGKLAINNFVAIGGEALVQYDHADTEIALSNGIHTGYKQQSVYLWDAAIKQPNIKNVIFVGAAGSKPIVSQSIRVCGDIDNNLYNTANGNLTDGGHSVPTADPKFVSTSDFHLRPDSPCLGTGTKIPGITTDIEGSPLVPPYNIGPYGLAEGALGVAPVANDGPPRNNITRLTGTSTTINPTDTYKLADTNACRTVTGWTVGTANDFFDENGAPIPFTGQQLIDAGIGPRLYCGSTWIAGYTIDQENPEQLSSWC